MPYARARALFVGLVVLALGIGACSPGASTAAANPSQPAAGSQPATGSQPTAGSQPAAPGPPAAPQPLTRPHGSRARHYLPFYLAAKTGVLPPPALPRP